MGAKMLWALSGIVIAATLQWLGVTAQTVSAPVTVAGTTVTLNCPLVEPNNLQWFKKQKPADSDLQSNTPEYVISEFTDSNNGEYYCKDGTSTYRFYIRAKVCQGCIELNTGMVIGIICGDLFFTLLVAMLVYWFAKQRGAAAKDFRPLEPIYPPSRPPAMAAAHQSEYAPIKSGQRDVYDKLQRR